jgi:hypothetical protein
MRGPLCGSITVCCAPFTHSYGLLCLIYTFLLSAVPWCTSRTEVLSSCCLRHHRQQACGVGDVAVLAVRCTHGVAGRGSLSWWRVSEASSGIIKPWQRVIGLRRKLPGDGLELDVAIYLAQGSARYEIIAGRRKCGVCDQKQNARGFQPRVCLVNRGWKNKFRSKSKGTSKGNNRG